MRPHRRTSRAGNSALIFMKTPLRFTPAAQVPPGHLPGCWGSRVEGHRTTGTLLSRRHVTMPWPDRSRVVVVPARLQLAGVWPSGAHSCLLSLRGIARLASMSAARRVRASVLLAAMASCSGDHPDETGHSGTGQSSAAPTAPPPRTALTSLDQLCPGLAARCAACSSPGRSGRWTVLLPSGRSRLPIRLAMTSKSLLTSGCSAQVPEVGPRLGGGGRRGTAGAAGSTPAATPPLPRFGGAQVGEKVESGGGGPRFPG